MTFKPFEVLDYYDGPVLISLESTDGVKCIGYICDFQTARYLVFQPAEGEFDRYMVREIDLLDAINGAVAWGYGTEEDARTITLTGPWGNDLPVPGENKPLPGYFNSAPTCKGGE